jgi:hypothetical protein
MAAADAAEMRLHGAAARHCLSALVGRTEGERLEDEVRAWVQLQDVRAPERMLRTITPLPMPPKDMAPSS